MHAPAPRASYGPEGPPSQEEQRRLKTPDRELYAIQKSGASTTVLEIPYTTVVPYSFQVILDQYFDFEHIAHVHPTTLGQYVLVENSKVRIVYDQIWPANRKGRRAMSRVVQTYEPPGDIWFEFVSGKHKGVKVHSRLRPHAQGTELIETYYIPWLPNWGILRCLIAPNVHRQVDRIWKEDLDVGVCIGGWPGVPSTHGRAEGVDPKRGPGAGIHCVGSVQQFPSGSLTLVNTAEGQLIIAHTEKGLRALHPICPHTGGPLRLGKLDQGCIVCPWHGARFDVNAGQPVSGPSRMALPTFPVRVENGDVIVEVLPHAS